MYLGNGVTAPESEVGHLLRTDDWAVADGVTDRGAITVRFRTPVLAAGQGRSHPQALQVLWTYGDEGGGPDEMLERRMAAFEDRLIERLEADGVAVAVSVVTHDGTRQWLFYTADLTECSQRLHDLSVEFGESTLEFNTQHDEQWDYLHHEVLLGIDLDSLDAH